MDSTSIELAGSEVATIHFEVDVLRVNFSRAYIIETMTGSEERTRWWQAGDLVLEGVELEGEVPQGPLVCTGGDVVENIYTYRDMIPIPLDSQGHTRCDLGFVGTGKRLRASGRRVRLEMKDVPKYLEHIRTDKH